MTFSGGLVPGGLNDRMKAMIFHKWSEVLMVEPIGGIGTRTRPKLIAGVTVLLELC